MSKKHFIALADAIRHHNAYGKSVPFCADQLDLLAEFCKQQNPRFYKERWLGYIRGENGPNGGKR